MAGFLTRTVLYPFEYSRNKMSNKIKGGKGGVWNCLQLSFQKEGLWGIYRGSMVSLIGVTIFRSTYFGIFDSLKVLSTNAVDRWAASYLGVFCAIVLTYPSDTVRRRMMLTSGENYKYEGFRDCASKIYGQEGVRGFFSGGTMIFLQSVTSATVYFIIDKIIRDCKGVKEF